MSKQCSSVLRWPSGEHARCVKPVDHARGDNHMGRTAAGRAVWWVWFHSLAYRRS